MAEQRRPGGPERRPFRPLKYLMPLLFVAVFAMVLIEAVPPLGNWVEGLTAPQRVQARETCASAALAAADDPAFARLIDQGEAHPTQSGFYVEKAIVGERGEAGREVRYAFSCYVDAEGRVVGTDKHPY